MTLALFDAVALTVAVVAIEDDFVLKDGRSVFTQTSASVKDDSHDTYVEVLPSSMIDPDSKAVLLSWRSVRWPLARLVIEVGDEVCVFVEVTLDEELEFPSSTGQRL